ncbi:2-Cys peroxiredoxin [Alishewanella longhuensis]|uniref:2-Cys peroxiredoxin n=1 Tax=Alishewanella longhuensis TaxID=1091037 RepID=A0ABQ3KY06_9ALTE|nr:thiol peroxidase [Alishewanella longhuensis]GHG64438.1 2-Cys peroxiredoxin [Alishewanella longhuensis]
MFLNFQNSSKILAALCFSTFSLNSIAIDSTEKLTARVSNVKAGERQIVLLGNKLQTGQPAPPFKVVDNNFKSVSLADYSGKTLLLSVVPSIDTGICSLQTKRFNDEVSKLPADVVLLTISTDLPFAQKRFCQQEQVEAMAVLSDAVWRDFGSNYGLLIKDMGLLARTIIIIDKNGVVAYQQMVPELAQEPDYDAALAALQKILAS